MIEAEQLPVPADLGERIAEADYARLLGYPEARLPAGRVRDLAEHSRTWYQNDGRPWAFVRHLGPVIIHGERIQLADDAELVSSVLARRLAGARATEIVAAAVSAGPEVDAASATLWEQDRPDAAYFLDRFGAAAAEHLAAWTGRQLRAAAERGGLAALPGYSPGHEGWPLEQQVTVAHCLTAGRGGILPGRFEVLDSGMIRPKNSLIAVFGLTEHQEIAAEAWKRHKCSWCSLAGCAFRQAPSSPA